MQTRHSEAFLFLNSRTTMSSSIIIRQPDAPQQLFLLCHGVGASAQDLVPVGQHFAARFPDATVVSLQGPQACDFGQGRQWFSVSGITEESRPARVAQALPAFQSMVQAWQDRCALGADATTLIGFSQGSIMSLASTQNQPLLASRVVAFAGRFAAAPAVAPAGMSVHLIHGEADPVISVEHSRMAAQQLQALGVHATLYTEPGMGHGINAAMLARALDACQP